jgi:DnaJ-class molecular chaperone
MADFYSVLGVGRGAPAKEIKDAYRRLARKFHPDVNPGDKSAESRFKQVNEAYHVLSNPKTKKDYDQFGDNWKHAEQLRQAGARAGVRGGPDAQAGWSDMSGGVPYEVFQDLLGGLGFGGRQRGRGFDPSFAGEAADSSHPAQSVAVDVTLEEAYRGATRLISLDREEPCEACGGSGRRGRGVCSSCSGRGAHMRATRLEVKIPAGIEDGGKVWIRPSGGTEIVFAVSVRPDSRFRRQGADLYTDVEVPFTDAILGGEAVVGTMTGRVALKIPAGTPAGKTFRIAGKGMPRLGGGEPGSLFARVAVTVPDEMSEEEKRLIGRLRELQDGARVG